MVPHGRNSGNFDFRRTGVSRVVPGSTDPERFAPTEDRDGVLFGGAESLPRENPRINGERFFDESGLASKSDSLRFGLLL